jgi:hypothetical protein
MDGIHYLTIRFKIIRATPMHCKTKMFQRGDDSLRSLRGRQTAASLDAAMTSVDAKRSLI